MTISAAGALAFGIHKTTANENFNEELMSSSSKWDNLRSKLNGTLIARSENGYQSVCDLMLWNARKSTKRPDAIIHAANDADVGTAVLFAKSNGLRISVRGGGHSLGSPLSLRESGILLDLSALNEIKIDIENRTAIVQPAITGNELASKLSPLNLAFPVGHCPTVPLSGYLLNGGIGWNSGEWGLACMSVNGIELVNANGELIYADENQNADFYWAARGAGPGFFGIITRYHIKLYDLPKAIRTSTLFFDLNNLENIANRLLELTNSLPPQVELISSMVTLPDKQKHILVVSATVFCNTEEDALSCLKPVENELASLAINKELYVTASMESLLSSMNNLFPKDFRYGSDAFWTNSSPVDFITTLKKCAVEAPSPHSLILFALTKSPGPDVPKPETAFSMAGRAFIGVYNIWENTTDDEKNILWLKETANSLEPFTIGYYIGECNLSAASNRAEKCFSPSNWEKLKLLKKKRDPDEIFFWFP